MAEHASVDEHTTTGESADLDVAFRGFLTIPDTRVALAALNRTAEVITPDFRFTDLPAALAAIFGGNADDEQGTIESAHADPGGPEDPGVVYLSGRWVAPNPDEDVYLAALQPHVTIGEIEHVDGTDLVVRVDQWESGTHQSWCPSLVNAHVTGAVTITSDEQRDAFDALLEVADGPLGGDVLTDPPDLPTALRILYFGDDESAGSVTVMGALFRFDGQAPIMRTGYLDPYVEALTPHIDSGQLDWSTESLSGSEIWYRGFYSDEPISDEQRLLVDSNWDQVMAQQSDQSVNHPPAAAGPEDGTDQRLLHLPQRAAGDDPDDQANLGGDGDAPQQQTFGAHR